MHRPAWRRAGIAVFLLAILAAGVWVRSWTWRTTAPIRWTPNITSAFAWGARVAGDARVIAGSPGTDPAPWADWWRAYVGLYDRVAAEQPEGRRVLDYAPLRLLIVSLWVRGVQAWEPGARAYQPEYAPPLLWLNTTLAAVAAAGMFLLVRLWSGGPVHRRLRGTACGLAAALLLWINPALILEAHGWPQWEVWVLPFYLFAAYSASLGRWATAGVLVGAGALLKGQILLVAPFFALWPVFARDWSAAARFVVGLAATVAVGASPWLVGRPEGWFLALLPATLAAAWAGRKRTWSETVVWGAGGLAVGLALCVPLAGGSMTWWNLGYLHRTGWPQDLSRTSASNLASWLESRGWGFNDRIALGWWAGVSVRAALLSSYGAALALCAWGAARGAARGSPRLLAAVAAPWLAMFALMPQMDGRYLLWGACVSAGCMAIGWGGLVAHLAATALSFGTIMAHMTGGNPRFWPELHAALEGWETAAVGGVLAVTAAVCCAACAEFRGGRACSGSPARRRLFSRGRWEHSLGCATGTARDVIPWPARIETLCEASAVLPRSLAGHPEGAALGHHQRVP